MNDTQCLIRKLTIARHAIESARNMLVVLRSGMMGVTLRRLAARRSAMFSPATDEWHSVRDGRWSEWIVSIGTDW